MTSALGWVSEQSRTLSGELRLAVSSDLVASMLPDVVAGFCARHPEIRLDVRTTTYRDLASRSFEVALSSAPFRLPDSSLVARKLGPIDLGVYAARGYLDSSGHPRTLEDARRLAWVVLSGVKLSSPLARPELVRVRCEDPHLLLHAVRSGLGLGALPAYLTAPYVATGALVHVLPRVALRVGGIYLIAPTSPLPAKVRAFADHVRSHLALGRDGSV